MKALRILALTTLILGLSLAGLLAYLSATLSTPERRPLMDYHKSSLNTPENHGIKIERAMSTLGSPVLIIEPDGAPGKRGATLRAQLESTVPFGEIRANLVLLHGRKGRKEDLLPVAERFCAVGFRCILIDLPAHGDCLREENCFATTEEEGNYIAETFTALQEDKNWGTLPTHLWGMSLGGAFANKTLFTHPNLWQRAVIVCSFDSLPRVIEGKLPVLPTSALKPFATFKIEECQPAEWAKSLPHPVLVAHGTEDRLITHEQGKRLYKAYQNPAKKFITVEGAHHENILITDHPLFKEMAEFLLTEDKRD